MFKENQTYIDFRLDVLEDFQEVFSHFYFAENLSKETVKKTLLPSYQTLLIFNFGAKAVLYSDRSTIIEINKCIVLGPVKNAFDYALPSGSKLLVAVLKNDAFYRFFGTNPVSKEFSFNPDDLLSENCFNALWSKLDKIEGAADQLQFILTYSKPYLKQRDPVFEKMVLFRQRGLSPIKSIAISQNQTERMMQIYHKKYTGYSAKEFNRYQRFLSAIRLIQHNSCQSKKIDWFEVIQECGYYDQSQLIHDFQHYIKLSPTKYLKFQKEICNSFR